MLCKKSVPLDRKPFDVRLNARGFTWNLFLGFFGTNLTYFYRRNHLLIKSRGKYCSNIVFLLLTFLLVFDLLSLGNVLVVTELIHGGSLENILKAKRAPRENNNYHNVCCKLNDRQLVTIAFQIAAGMQHLEERKVRPVDSA